MANDISKKELLLEQAVNLRNKLNQNIKSSEHSGKKIGNLKSIYNFLNKPMVKPLLLTFVGSNLFLKNKKKIFFLLLIFLVLYLILKNSESTEYSDSDNDDENLLLENKYIEEE